MNEKRLIQKYSGLVLICGPIAVTWFMYSIIIVVFQIFHVLTNQATDIALSVSSVSGVIAYVGIAIWEVRNS